MRAFMARASVEYGRPFSYFANMSVDDFVMMQAAQQLYGWPSSPVVKKAESAFENDAIAQLSGIFGALGK